MDCPLCGEACEGKCAKPAAPVPARARATIAGRVVNKSGDIVEVNAFDPAFLVLPSGRLGRAIQYALPPSIAAAVRIGDTAEYVGGRAPTAGSSVIQLKYANMRASEKPCFVACVTAESLFDFLTATFPGGAFPTDEVIAALAETGSGAASRFLTGAAVCLLELRRRTDTTVSVGVFASLSAPGVKTPATDFIAAVGRAHFPKLFPKRLTPRQLERLLAKWVPESVRPFLAFGVPSFGAALGVVGRARWSLAGRARAAVSAAIAPAVGVRVSAGKACACTLTPSPGVWCAFHDDQEADAALVARVVAAPATGAKPASITAFTAGYERAFARLPENPFAFIGPGRLPSVAAAAAIAEATSSAPPEMIARFRWCAELTETIEASLDDHVEVDVEEFAERAQIATCTFGLVATAIPGREDAVAVTTLQRFFAIHTVVERLRAAAANPPPADFELPARVATEPLVAGVPASTPAPEQLEAIRAVIGAAVADKPTIITVTGGPGSGKTTLIRGIVTELARLKFSLRILAPTGKAVSCVCGSTRTPASLVATVHRALRKGDVSPRVLLIDESSMLPTELLARLFRASSTKVVVFLGDADQLPSIEWGHLFAVLCSGAIPGLPVIRLRSQFRVSAQSSGSLESLFSAIRAGAPPPSPIAAAFGDAVRIIAAPGNIAAAAVAVAQRIVAETGVDIKRVAVITPLRRDRDEANDALRRALTPARPRGGDGSAPPLGVGDRVRVSKNVYLNAESEQAKEAVGTAASRLVIERDRAGKPQTALTQDVIERFMRCTIGGCRIAVHGDEECGGCESAAILAACTGDNAAARAGFDVMNGETGTIALAGEKFIEVQFDSAANRVIRFYRVPAAAAAAAAVDAPGRNFAPEGGVFDADGDGIIGPCDAAVTTTAGLTIGLLQRAFALTVHLSQGSEYDHVVLAINSANPNFLTRCLFYTAATRAKISLTILFSADFGTAERGWSRVVGGMEAARNGLMVAACVPGESRSDAAILAPAASAADPPDDEDGADAEGW